MSNELRERFSSDRRLAFLPDVMAGIRNGEWFVVGGAVRDAMLGRPVNDIDLVVRNVRLERLEEFLSKRGSVAVVGRSFGVLKFRPKGVKGEIDIAWPRTERAGGSGAYRDFEISTDATLPLEDDLARRDFTINAMALNLADGRLVDPFGGRADLERKVIRAVGEPDLRLAEDYSRMLRGIRFSCELGFEIEASTWQAICRLMPRIDDTRRRDDGEEERIVPFEVIAKEWIKAATADPVRCLQLYESSGALPRLVPELALMSGCKQSPNHHSEGDAWTHTKMAVTALASPEFAEFFPGQRPSAETFFATLFHDIAKPLTARERDGKITFYGHSEVGATLAKKIANRLKLSNYAKGGIDPDRLSWLLHMHLFPNMVQLDEVRRTTLVKHFLSDRAAGRELLHLAFADASASVPEGGRPDLSTLRRLVDTLGELERQLAEQAENPAKAVTGNDVMAATGIGPGPDIGRILDLVREAQLRGEIKTPEDAKKFLREVHPKK
ncbi:CCA tRNA nucleotidyltransferase [Candidatus Uhrbacteria bacterium]|nr:CCA tRNA nucleotidyltransferase [Candidatus Uhrbacteria bacterium]